MGIEAIVHYIHIDIIFH